jgi:polyphosphate kinase
MLKLDFLPTLPSLLVQSRIPLIHRDLSWLQFNERVLAEAQAPANPWLERAKFLAISSSNLDEFFMIRFASLGRAIQGAGKADGTRSESALRLERIRDNILEATAKFGARQHEALDMLAAELEPEGIRIVRHPHESDPAFAIGKRAFEDQILTRLAPPEGFATGKVGLLENHQLGVVYRNGIWFRIPKALPAVLSAREGGIAYFFFLDDLLASHLGAAFRLEGAAGFLKLTRDGDFTVDLEEEDTESIPDVVRTGLGSREKGRAVRLQYWGDVAEEMLQQIIAALKLIPGQVLPAPSTLCLHGLWAVVNQTPEEIASRPGLKYPSRSSTVPAALREGPESEAGSIFARLRRHDVLLHHPYDSFDSFVNWIRASCRDTQVTRIEQTVYRMDALSPVIEALKQAARTKTVRVIIELRARFDELNNLALAEDLRRAGVEVAFGFGKLKLHAKIALVTRNETDQDGDGAVHERLYTHLSTGNYNAYTSRQYTDLAVLTANREVGEDARSFFDAVWRGEVPSSFRQLVPAPTKLHRLLVSQIQAETQAAREGRRARIVAKVNALVDEAVIEQLYQASRAGVQVDLIVRGACSLIPGVKGLSENIRVISVVDQFLEHSRIYSFADSRKMYLSSADWMPRNFFSRLEIAFPVIDPELYRYLDEVLIPAYLSDTVKARELTPQGTWKKRTLSSVRSVRPAVSEALLGKKPIRSQLLFQELAANQYAGTPLEVRE